MSLTAEDARRLQRCLEGDGVAVLPTDTVYGLACNPAGRRAIERLYELKHRPPRKPAAVMFFALAPALRALPELGSRTVAALEALLPGPVTLLLPNPRERFPLACAAGASMGPLGLRVPLLEGPLAALADVSAPALQSSANLSGGGDPRRVSDVPRELLESADLVLDGGELPGTASTVIDLSCYEEDGIWRLVREGPLRSAQLERVLG